MIRFLGLRDWIMDEKLVIDHVSAKGQLSGIMLFEDLFLDRPTKVSTALPCLLSLFLSVVLNVYVCMVITYSRICVNRVRLPVLLVVS